MVIDRAFLEFNTQKQVVDKTQGMVQVSGRRHGRPPLVVKRLPATRDTAKAATFLSLHKITPSGLLPYEDYIIEAHRPGAKHFALLRKLEGRLGVTICSDKKHPCGDCRACQGCSPARCHLCQGQGGRQDSGRFVGMSLAEQIALFEAVNQGQAPEGAYPPCGGDGQDPHPGLARGPQGS